MNGEIYRVGILSPNLWPSAIAGSTAYTKRGLAVIAATPVTLREHIVEKADLFRRTILSQVKRYYVGKETSVVENTARILIEAVYGHAMRRDEVGGGVGDSRIRYRNDPLNWSDNCRYSSKSPKRCVFVALNSNASIRAKVVVEPSGIFEPASGIERFCRAAR